MTFRQDRLTPVVHTPLDLWRGPASPEVDALDALVDELGQPEIVRTHRRSEQQYLVVFAFADAHGGASVTEYDLQAAADVLRDHIDDSADHLEELWVSSDDLNIVALLTSRSRRTLTERVRRIAIELTETTWLTPLGHERHLEVGTSWSALADRTSTAEYHEIRRSTTAAAHVALGRHDLICVPHDATGGRGRRAGRGTLALQILGTFLAGFGIPFVTLVAFHHLGHDITVLMYLLTVSALLFTSMMIWSECLLAMRPPKLPPVPDTAAPIASAIVAAYLPNEADTIIETLGHVLAQDYPGELQVILAYNSPVDLPVEAELALLARRHPELQILKIRDSTSKAQNVNQAPRHVRGEFVAIFDADHQPAPGSFSRAWRWIADGVDVVQGHCVIRNGEESLVARTVAVEFEQIYAVSHPGRAELHGFGIFGGSNGYWRTDVLRRMRMRVDRLTEDIDVSIRSTLAGHRIVNDPGLISRELAPTTMPALWKQRMRWSQGWFQVTHKSTGAVLRSDRLTGQQRRGMLVLMPWREIYPWLSMLMVPIVAFMFVRDGYLAWGPPLFLMTSVYTLTCGPVQALFAWRLAMPEIRRHRSWFVIYVFCVSPFYTEWKNTIARVAQVKELLGEHEWTVTPRTSGAARPAGLPGSAEVAS